MACARAFFDTPTAENIFLRAVKSGDIENVIAPMIAEDVCRHEHKFL